VNVGFFLLLKRIFSHNIAQFITVNRRIGFMKLSQPVYALILGVLLSYAALRCQGDEKITAVSNALSSTTIGGDVDTSVCFSYTNASVRGFAGTWIGLLTDRTATNRIEGYVIVDEAGNFAGRGMHYDRTLGSDQFEGTLDRFGRAKIGQARLYFHRDGSATVIGRGDRGRYFSARLLRERIR